MAAATTKFELQILTRVLGGNDAFQVTAANLDQVTIKAKLLTATAKIDRTVDIVIYIEAYPTGAPVFVVTDENEDGVPEAVENAIGALSNIAAGTPLVLLVATLYTKLGYGGDCDSLLRKEYKAAQAEGRERRPVGNADHSEEEFEEFNDDDDDAEIDEEFDDIEDDDNDDDDDDDAMFAIDRMEIKSDKLENAKHQMLLDKLKSEASVVKKESLQATDRLMKELQLCYRSENVKNDVYSIELMDDNIKEWKIRIFKLDEDSNIMKALKVLQERFPEHNCIVLHASFCDEFPIKPPFFRVMSPLIQGGHVMSGGAICAEVLTSSGWSSAYSIDSLIIQVGQIITKVSTISTKGTEALNYGQYTKKNAAKSFSQLIKYHQIKGWGKQKLSDG